MRKLIKVTQECIDNGIFCSMGSCPVAIALHKEFDMEIDVRANINNCTLKYEDVYFYYMKDDGLVYKQNAPRSVKRFITKFDNEKTVKPFNFYFDLDKGTFANEND